jgi:hypothetical protein
MQDMSKKKKARRGALAFDDVREIALSMPEVTETTSWGMPTLKAGKTTFAVEPYRARSRLGRHELREILTAAWHHAMEHGSAKRARRKRAARARAVRR